MKHSFLITAAATAAAALALAACGGGSGDAGSGGTSGTPPAAYVFATPKVNEQSTFSEISVSNQNNSWNQTLHTHVTTVNADGSFVQQNDDPSGNTVTSGGIDYTIYPTTYTFNSMAQETSEVISYPSFTDTCDFSPNGGSAPSPLLVGQSWSANYTACSNGTAPYSYSLNGSLVGMESVTVPAGTFSTFKFQTTLTFTEPSGTVVTETTTTWRNANPADSRPVQQQSSYSYAGTAPPQGVIVSRTRVLQSYQ